MIRIALILSILSIWSCDFARNVIWPATVTCSAPVAGALVDEIKHIIETGGSGQDLSAEAIAALEKLAADNGPQLVACILGQLIDGWLPANGFAAPLANANYAARAQGFLNDHQVTVREAQ